MKAYIYTALREQFSKLPEVLFPGYNPQIRLKTFNFFKKNKNKKTYIQMFTTALFVTAKNWNQATVNKWMDKLILEHSHNVILISNKRNELILMHVTTRISG